MNIHHNTPHGGDKLRRNSSQLVTKGRIPTKLSEITGTTLAVLAPALGRRPEEIRRGREEAESAYDTDFNS